MLDPSIFQAVFENSSTSELLLSPSSDPIILAANNALLRATGRVREDLVGKRLFEAFPDSPGDSADSGVAAIRRSLEKVIATGQTDALPFQRYPIEVRLPNGATRFEERYWTPSSTPVFGADGQLLCISHRTIDITERKRAEDAARQVAAREAFRLELLERLRAVRAPTEIVSAATECLGRHLGVACVLFTEVSNERQTDLIRSYWFAPGLTGSERRIEDFGAELIKDWQAGNQTAVADTTFDPRTAKCAEAQASARSLLAVPVVRAAQLTALLVAHQSTARVWTEYDKELATDLAELTWSAAESARSQAELRAERDLIKSILESMAEGFVLLAPDWTIVQLNPLGASIAQRPRSELIGRDHWEEFPESVGTEIEAVYRRVQTTGRPEHLEQIYTFPNGSQRWIEVRAYRVPNGHLAVFFHDITGRKETEETLKQANARKDEFLAMLAHELRNPLAPIASAAALMQMKKLDEPGVRRTSEVIARQVRHMTSLVDDLLDVSRVTRGLIELDEVNLDARDIIAEAVEQITPLIRQRRHDLVVHTPPVAALVKGDRKRLVQVIANLLNNSAKYTPEGGNIEIRTEVRLADVQIQVTDNGIGIAPDLLPHLFDLFSQGKRTPDRASGGLGLGLALVRSLVELHGGTVSCSSKGPGQGSCFTVCLPHFDSQQGLPSSDATLAVHAGSKNLRVLVVDDNADAAAMLAMFLEASGHQVMVEYSSARALVRVKEEPPEVCLLDIGLPEMDGYELARRIRAEPETARTVLIAVTGYGQEGDRRQSRAAGFKHHLVKPVQVEELGAILARISEEVT